MRDPQEAGGHGLMWVRLLEWMIADAEPPMRTIGSMLTGVGIRVRGEVTTARPESPDGIVEIQGRAPIRARE
jgi:hypothetical protein